VLSQVECPRGLHLDNDDSKLLVHPLFELMLSERILALQVLIARYGARAKAHPLRESYLEYKSLAEQAQSELDDLMSWDQ
jgi:hypothetical protein